MHTWLTYTETVSTHTVTGDLRVLRDCHSPQLDNKRDVLVWLPPDYTTSEQRYPVIYMHDGQNLFDAHTSYSGEWRIDETMQSRTGQNAIIVGLPNMNERRIIEYNPYHSMLAPELNGQGDAYVRFIVETVKPMIDSTFRTLPGRGDTGIAGSSMGGLISLYAFCLYADVFGLCGAFSPAYWFGDGAIFDTVRDHAHGRGGIYMDVGGKEGHIFPNYPEPHRKTEAEGNIAYRDNVRRLRDLLNARGYVDGEALYYVEDATGRHNEADWARRYPAAIDFLLS